MLRSKTLNYLVRFSSIYGLRFGPLVLFFKQPIGYSSCSKITIIKTYKREKPKNDNVEGTLEEKNENAGREVEKRKNIIGKEEGKGKCRSIKGR